MNKTFLVSFLLLSIFIYKTKSINCYICSSTSSTGCSDPLNSTGLLTNNQPYCEKRVSVTGVIERSSGTTCPTINIIGITSVYCCSDRDLCNHTNYISSYIFIFQILFLIINYKYKFIF